MPLLVIYIFLICFAVVVIIITAAIFKSRRPGEKLSDTLGMPVSLFLSIVSFCMALCLGMFVTQFAAPTLTTWWWAPALRVAWQLGSGLLLAGGLLKLDINRTTCVLASIVAALAVFICISPLLDLAQGPLQVVGTVTMDKHRTRSSRGEGLITAQLHLRPKQGAGEELDLNGWNVEEADEKLAGCAKGSTVQITVLRHLGKVIDVKCQ